MKFVKLIEVAEPINRTIKSFDGERIYVATGDLIGSTIHFDTTERVTYENRPSRASQQVQRGEVIFAKMMATDKSLIIDDQNSDHIYSSGFFVLKSSKELLPEYLYYFLRSKSFHLQKDKNCSGATQKAINLGGLGKVIIPLPSIEEQNRIVQKLDRIAELISLKKEVINKTERLRRSLFFQVFGDISKNDKGFEYAELGAVLSIGAKLVDPSNSDYQNLPCIGGANIVSETGELISVKTAKQEGSISGKFLVNSEDVLYSKIRPKLKKVSHPGIDCLCSADIYPLRPNLEFINRSYLIQYLLSDSFTAVVSEIAEKRAQIPKVNREELFSLKMPIPPIELQMCFEKLAESTFANMAASKESLRKLQSLYDSTVQEIFG